MKRKRIGMVLLGLGVAGLAVASAASLGGINSDNLGADVGVVASCNDDGVDVSYTTAFSTTTLEYEVTEVDVTNIDAACDGQTLSLTLSDGTDDIGSGSTTVASGAAELTGFSTSAEAVTDVAIVIAN